MEFSVHLKSVKNRCQFFKTIYQKVKTIFSSCCFKKVLATDVIPFKIVLGDKFLLFLKHSFQFSYKTKTIEPSTSHHIYRIKFFSKPRETFQWLKKDFTKKTVVEE